MQLMKEANTLYHMLSRSSVDNTHRSDVYTVAIVWMLNAMLLVLYPLYRHTSTVVGVLYKYYVSDSP